MHNNVPHDELVERLRPPKEAKLSIILNSVGNGIMLGTAPFVVGKTIEGITKNWRLPRWLHIFDAVAMVAGVAWGLHSGKKEFNRLQSYRESVSEQIVKINDELAAQGETQNQWVKKYEAGKAKAAEQSPETTSPQR